MKKLHIFSQSTSNLKSPPLKTAKGRIFTGRFGAGGVGGTTSRLIWAREMFGVGSTLPKTADGSSRYPSIHGVLYVPGGAGVLPSTGT